jgi:hypothetical protein
VQLRALFSTYFGGRGLGLLLKDAAHAAAHAAVLMLL